MYSVQVIANEILRLAKKRGLHLTPMQLVKLAYIAHGWSFAIFHEGLFPDEIQAWKYGPVIPNLYQATKHFGRNHIPHELINDEEDSYVSGEIEEFLDDVVSKYGHLSGIQLSNLTHQPGTPWHQVYRPNTMNLEISNDLIYTYYLDKLNEYNKSTAIN